MMLPPDSPPDDMCDEERGAYNESSRLASARPPRGRQVSAHGRCIEERAHVHPHAFKCLFLRLFPNRFFLSFFLRLRLGKYLMRDNEEGTQIAGT